MQRQIQLTETVRIGADSPCFIVADIGQNHQGDAYTALRLTSMAARAKVDAVKFCKRDITGDLTKQARAAPYTGRNSFGATYGEHRERLELSRADYVHLGARFRYNEYRLIYFATVCDIPSADLIEQVWHPPLYKIASRDLSNLPLIEHVAALNKPIILSTGLAQPNDIERALATIERYHRKVALLYCISVYPCPDEYVALKSLEVLERRYDCIVGFSDHTVGIHLAQAAVALGAKIVEKHITLARTMPGSDHAGSLESHGLELLVRNIRSIERALHGPDRAIRKQREAELRRSWQKLGRSIVSKRPIKRGETIKSNDLTLKSPGTGLPWSQRNLIVGRPALRDIDADQVLQATDVAST